MQIAVEKGRKTRPDIKLGICGEHGGDPTSVEFCHMVGLNYVSCSPYRVPIARLAAAQAAILNPPKAGGEEGREEDGQEAGPQALMLRERAGLRGVPALAPAGVDFSGLDKDRASG